MAKTDLVLLHAPSVYDFREKAILYGPVSDVIPSTQIFEMYPIGFMTMLQYLEERGYSVRIINVASQMLRNRRFDVEKLIRSLRTKAFGIDLHWLVHAQGSLELASLVKRIHPTTPMIFGGLSASYYHEELIAYPQVDYVIRGDSAEEPLRQLMGTIAEDRSPSDVANLTWQQDGETRVNAISYAPKDLDAVSFDYRKMMRSTVKHRDLFGHLPFRDWLNYPIVVGLSCRGCVHRCVTCGGSASAFARICDRHSPAFRGPEKLAEDIGTTARTIKAPIIILGDILQAGEDSAVRFLRALGTQKVTNHVAFEFFKPPPRSLLEEAARAVPNFNIQMSPESHDVNIRRQFGRNYDNESLEAAIEDAFELGCGRLDLFFMIGLPEQTVESVRGTIGYCESLLSRFDARFPKRLLPFISPLAPFLDPGSDAFEEPDRFGYRLFARTLEEHRRALLQPSWKYVLNYETTWMTRDEIVLSTYEAAHALNRLKAEYGLIRQHVADQVEQRIEAEKRIMHEIDAILESAPKGEEEGRIEELMRRFSHIGPYTLCDEDEMKWPARFVRFSPLRTIRSALFRRR